MVTPLPDTQCPTCRQAEMTWWQRFMESLFGDPNRGLITGMGTYFTAMLTVAMAAGPVETWYDKHRKRYVETGDEKELIRMKRHVG